MGRRENIQCKDFIRMRMPIADVEATDAAFRSIG